MSAPAGARQTRRRPKPARFTQGEEIVLNPVRITRAEWEEVKSDIRKAFGRWEAWADSEDDLDEFRKNVLNRWDRTNRLLDLFDPAPAPDDDTMT